MENKKTKNFNDNLVQIVEEEIKEESIHDEMEVIKKSPEIKDIVEEG